MKFLSSLLTTSAVRLTGENAAIPAWKSHFGTNYGNRFIPEQWMDTTDYDIFEGPDYGPAMSKPDGVDHFSLCDITDRRILKYLDKVILEEHF